MSCRCSTVANPSWMFQAVLKEYLRLDRECTEKAKDLLQKRNLPYEHFGKIKRQIAAEKGFSLGDESLDWMTTQMIESFMQSPHVEEVFADDATPGFARLSLAAPTRYRWVPCERSQTLPRSGFARLSLAAPTRYRWVPCERSQTLPRSGFARLSLAAPTRYRWVPCERFQTLPRSGFARLSLAAPTRYRWVPCEGSALHSAPAPSPTCPRASRGLANP
jgi:hypothetical protein